MNIKRTGYFVALTGLILTCGVALENNMVTVNAETVDEKEDFLKEDSNLTTFKVSSPEYINSLARNTTGINLDIGFSYSKDKDKRVAYVVTKVYLNEELTTPVYINEKPFESNKDYKDFVNKIGLDKENNFTVSKIDYDNIGSGGGLYNVPIYQYDLQGRMSNNSIYKIEMLAYTEEGKLIGKTNDTSKGINFYIGSDIQLTSGIPKYSSSYDDLKGTYPITIKSKKDRKYYVEVQDSLQKDGNFSYTNEYGLSVRNLRGYITNVMKEGVYSSEYDTVYLPYYGDYDVIESSIEVPKEFEINEDYKGVSSLFDLTNIAKREQDGNVYKYNYMPDSIGLKFKGVSLDKDYKIKTKIKYVNKKDKTDVLEASDEIGIEFINNKETEGEHFLYGLLEGTNIKNDVFQDTYATRKIGITSVAGIKNINNPKNFEIAINNQENKDLHSKRITLLKNVGFDGLEEGSKLNVYAVKNSKGDSLSNYSKEKVNIGSIPLDNNVDDEYSDNRIKFNIPDEYSKGYTYYIVADNLKYKKDNNYIINYLNFGLENKFDNADVVANEGKYTFNYSLNTLDINGKLNNFVGGFGEDKARKTIAVDTKKISLYFQQPLVLNPRVDFTKDSYTTKSRIQLESGEVLGTDIDNKTLDILYIVPNFVDFVNAELKVANNKVPIEFKELDLKGTEFEGRNKGYIVKLNLNDKVLESRMRRSSRITLNNSITYKYKNDFKLGNKGEVEKLNNLYYTGISIDGNDYTVKSPLLKSGKDFRKSILNYETDNERGLSLYSSTVDLRYSKTLMANLSVKGDKDTDYGLKGTVKDDGIAEKQVTLRNLFGDKADNIDAVFPVAKKGYNGILNNFEKNSDFNEYLTTKIKEPKGFEIEYTKDRITKDVSDIDNLNWVKDVDNYTDVTAFRLKSKEGVYLGEDDIIQFNYNTKYDSKGLDKTNYSSFIYKYNNFNYVETNPTEVNTEKTKYGNLFVNHLYKTEDTQGTIKTEEINGKVGDKWSTKPLDTTEYTLIESPKEQEGIYKEGLNDSVTYFYTKNKSKVIVNYKDIDGNKIEDSKILENYRGEDYETEGITKKGYELVKEPSNKIGEYEEGTIEVDYIYRKVEGKVIVEYVDSEGEHIEDDKVLTGLKDTEYKTEPLKIEGYEIKEYPKNKEGIYIKKDTKVTYVYNKKKTKITLDFIDDKGNKIADSIISTGSYKDKLNNINPKDIKGYTLVDNNLPKEVYFEDKDKTIQYVYKQNEYNVKIKHVDSTGKEIADSEVIKGILGKEYTSKPKEIKGYTLEKEPENAKGKLEETNKDVVYTYKQNEYNVKIKYVDSTGKEIADSEVIKGTLGKEYTSKSKEIKGYTLEKEPENASGKLEETTKDVVYTYKQNEYTIKVKYVDSKGKEIADSEVIKGTFGKDYIINKKSISNYKITDESDKYSSIKIENNLDITLIYNIIEDISESKPEETKPSETVPSESKPEETKPSETVPSESKPEETKPSETVTSESKSEETKPSETVPSESKPEGTESSEPVTSESKPEETKQSETITSESKPEETKQSETVTSESKTEETKSSESITNKIDLSKQLSKGSNNNKIGKEGSLKDSNLNKKTENLKGKNKEDLPKTGSKINNVLFKVFSFIGLGSIYYLFKKRK